LKLVPIHAMLVPFPQSILIGVVGLAFVALHVKLILYPLFVATGVDPVMILHVALVSVAVAEPHD